MSPRAIFAFLFSISLLSGCAMFKRISQGEPASEADATPPSTYAPYYARQIVPAPSDPAGLPKCALEISWIDAREPNRVKIYAHLVDTSGNYYSGATVGAYAGRWCDVQDSSAAFKAKDISGWKLSERHESDRMSIAVAYALDHSGSMGESRAHAIEDAVYDLVGKKEPSDAVAAIKYDSHVETEVPLTTSVSDFRAKLSRDGLGSQWGGATAILDAIGAGLEDLASAKFYDRRAVVLFTDGLDNSSTLDMDSLIRVARASNTLLTTIAFGDNINEDFLKNIADRTGGIYRHIYSTSEISQCFEDLYHRMRNYYLIEYTPPSYGIHRADIQLCLPNDTLRAFGYYDNTPNVGDVALLDVHFELNSAEVTSSSSAAIQGVATLLQTYPQLRIEVRGHTDSTNRTSDPDYNLKLSERRAQAVKASIVKAGVDPDRIVAKGFGSTMPIADNSTEDGRAKNRRTEFIVLAK